MRENIDSNLARQRGLSMQPDIWYVSYRSNIDRLKSSRAYSRATKRFETEAEAKQFAHEVVRNGWTAIAGTINPYTPKKIITPTRILIWIAERE